MNRPLPDLAGTIIAARRTYEAAVSVRGAVVSGGDQAALRLEVHDQFKNLATTLGYLVTNDEPDEHAKAVVEGRELASN